MKNVRKDSNLKRVLTYVFENCRSDQRSEWVYYAANSSVAVELCPEGGSVVRLVEFTDNILEVGGCYGTFTEKLSDKCNTLVSVEKDEDKRNIILLRKTGAQITDNIDYSKKYGIIWANFFEEDFSLYGFSSVTDAYKRLTKVLDKGGQMYFLVDGKKGIEFTEELRTVCAGISVFYPYPQLKYAQFLFSEDRLPYKSELCFHKYLCKGKPTEVRENRDFADVFILKIEPNKGEVLSGNRIIYSKMSASRRPQYQIYTDIIKNDNDDLFVVKSSLHNESNKHIEKMLNSYDELTKLYNKTIFSPNRAYRIAEGKVGFDFEYGETLYDQIINDFWGKGKEYIYNFAELLRSKALNHFTFSDGFYAMFGDALDALDSSVIDRFYSSPYTNLDFNFDNVIVRDGKWIIIDYEFCVDFPIPVDFIIFRSVFYLFRKMPESPEFKQAKREIYSKLGLKGYIKYFKRMELGFQKFYTGDGNDEFLLAKTLIMTSNGERTLPSSLRTLKKIKPYLESDKGENAKNLVLKIYEYRTLKQIIGSAIMPAIHRAGDFFEKHLSPKAFKELAKLYMKLKGLAR